MNTQTTRRKLTPEFKVKVVIEALREQSTLVDIAKKYEITQAQLSRWKKEFLANATAAFGGSEQQQEMKELEAKLMPALDKISGKKSSESKEAM